MCSHNSGKILKLKKLTSLELNLTFASKNTLNSPLLNQSIKRFDKDIESRQKLQNRYTHLVCSTWAYLTPLKTYISLEYWRSGSVLVLSTRYLLTLNLRRITLNSTGWFELCVWWKSFSDKNWRENILKLRNIRDRELI